MSKERTPKQKALDKRLTEEGYYSRISGGKSHSKEHLSAAGKRSGEVRRQNRELLNKLLKED